MCASLQVSRGWRYALITVVVTLAASAVAAAELKVSGVYADEGTTITSDPTLLSGEVSLHALLRLEFDHRLVAMRRDQTAEVRLNQTGVELAVEAYDPDGEVSWRSRWNVAQGASSQGRVVVIRLRAEPMDAREYLLLLEPINPELLQVTVRRVEATVLGPMVRATATYLFARLR